MLPLLWLPSDENWTDAPCSVLSLALSRTSRSCLSILTRRASTVSPGDLLHPRDQSVNKSPSVTKQDMHAGSGYVLCWQRGFCPGRVGFPRDNGGPTFSTVENAVGTDWLEHITFYLFGETQVAGCLWHRCVSLRGTSLCVRRCVSLPTLSAVRSEWLGVLLMIDSRGQHPRGNREGGIFLRHVLSRRDRNDAGVMDGRGGGSGGDAVYSY